MNEVVWIIGIAIAFVVGMFIGRRETMAAIDDCEKDIADVIREALKAKAPKDK